MYVKCVGNFYPLSVDGGRSQKWQLTIPMAKGYLAHHSRVLRINFGHLSIFHVRQNLVCTDVFAFRLHHHEKATEYAN